MRQLKILSLALTSVAIACFAGCEMYKTVYVPLNAPVQLRETILDVKVWVFDEDGVRRPGSLPLPEGAWVITDDGRELPPLESGTNTKKEGEK